MKQISSKSHRHVAFTGLRGIKKNMHSPPRVTVSDTKTTFFGKPFVLVSFSVVVVQQASKQQGFYLLSRTCYTTTALAHLPKWESTAKNRTGRSHSPLQNGFHTGVRAVDEGKKMWCNPPAVFAVKTALPNEWFSCRFEICLKPCRFVLPRTRQANNPVLFILQFTSCSSVMFFSCFTKSLFYCAKHTHSRLTVNYCLTEFSRKFVPLWEN